MSDKRKIRVSDKVMNMVFDGTCNVNDALRSIYEGEINDHIKENAQFADLSPMEIALYDAGISKNSTVNDIINAGTYTSADGAGNEWLLPAWIDTRIRESVAATNIMQYIVGSTVGIDGSVIKGQTLDLIGNAANKAATRKSRVVEGADIPLAKIKTGDVAISLYKYGRAVETTYEAMRRMRVDLFNRTLDAIAQDISQQELESAIDVLKDGDGNDNASTTIKTTAVADTLTESELVDACVEYLIANNYYPTTIIANKALYKEIANMIYSTDNAIGASLRVGLNLPQLQNMNLYCLYGDVPKISNKNIALLFNKDYTLVKYVENGSMIQEYAKNIRNQTNLGTISEVTGFGIFLKNSNKHITSA